jgi:2-methylcitrate dehydratase PrpD
MDAMGYAEGNPIEIELSDGTVLSAWGKVRGDAENPIHREDVVDKFRKLTARRMQPEQQAEIIGLCERLERVEDVSALIGALHV